MERAFVGHLSWLGRQLHHQLVVPEILKILYLRWSLHRRGVHSSLECRVPCQQQ